MSSGWVWALALATGLYAATCGLLFIAQRSLIYYPTPESRPSRAVDLRIDSGGEILQVWQLGPGKKDAIIYFGGNAEDVAANLPDFEHAFPDHTLYLANYRGYGASTGNPGEAALFADAKAIYDKVASDHARLHVMGRSLGSGVAIELASSRDVQKIALVTPYDSIARVAQAAMPIFPVRWLLKDRFDAERRAVALTNPTLILIAGNDEVIRRPHSERLAAAFGSRDVETVVIPGANHNDISARPGYWRALTRFFDIPD